MPPGNLCLHAMREASKFPLLSLSGWLPDLSVVDDRDIFDIPARLFLLPPDD